jgi:tellurite resistance protein TehA-like permease
MLIAWTVQTAIAVRAVHQRDAVQESIVGSLIGPSACGLAGIVILLGLAERAEVGHWIWVDRLAFALAGSALLFLGICVVLLVYLTYEWSRLSRIDPPE